MAEYRAGSAFITVSPVFSGFQNQVTKEAKDSAGSFSREFDQELGKQQAKSSPKVGPLGSGNSKAMHEAARGAAAQFVEVFSATMAKGIDDLDIDIRIDADSSDADKNLAALVARLNALRDKKVGVDITSAEAVSELQAIHTLMEAIDDDDITVDVDVAGAKAGLKSLGNDLAFFREDIELALVPDDDIVDLRNRLRGVSESIPDIEIGADASEVDRKVADIKARISVIEAGIGIDIDTNTVQAEIKRIQQDIAKLDWSQANIDVDADTEAAIAGLMAVEVLAERLDGKNIKLDTDKNALQQIKSDLSQVSFASSSTTAITSGLIAVLIDGAQAVTPLAAGAMALMSGITVGALGAAQGVGVLALAISPLTKAWQALDAEEDDRELKAQSRAKKAEQRAKAIRDAQRGVQDAERSLARAREDAAEAAVAADERVAEARANLAQVATEAAEAEVGAARAVRDAREGLAQAQERAAQAEADAQRAVVSAQKELARVRRDNARDARDAARGIAEAAAAVARAEEDGAKRVADALKSLTSARRDYTRAQEDSAERISDAARQVAEARSKLAEVQEESAERIADAEEQAAERNTRAAEQVTKARARLSQVAQDTARDLKDANDRVTQATISMAERSRAALDRVVTAEQRLADTQDRARGAQERLTRAREDAQRRLEDLAEAASDGRRSEEAAMLRVARAQEQIARQSSSTSVLDRAENDLALREAIDNLEDVRLANRRLAQDKAAADARGVEGSEEVTSAVKAQADAARDASEAEKDLTKAREDFGSEIIDGTEAIRVAEERLRTVRREAVTEEADARKALADAAAEQIKARREGVESVRDAEKDAAEGVLEARERLADAERRLANTRKDAAEAEVRARERIVEAEAAVVRARQDAARLTADAERRLRQARERSQEVAERSSERVLRAQEALSEATRRVGEVQRDNARLIRDAQESIADALERQRSVAQDNAQAQMEAEKDLSDAIARRAKTHRDSARSIADAQRNLQTAQERLNDAVRSGAEESSLASKKAQKALAALTPEARTLLTLLRSMREEFAELSRAAQRGLFPGITDAVRILRPMLDPLAGYIEDLGRVIGDAMFRAAQHLVGPWWQQWFKEMGPAFLDGLKDLLDGSGYLIEAMAALGQAFLPISTQASEDLKNAMKLFADWAKGLKDSPEFKAFVDWMFEIREPVIEFMRALRDAIVNVIKALAINAEDSLGGLTSFLKFIAGLDPNTLATFFDVVKWIARLVALAAGIAAIAKALGSVMWVVRGIGAAFRGLPKVPDWLRKQQAKFDPKHDGLGRVPGSTSYRPGSDGGGPTGKGGRGVNPPPGSGPGGFFGGGGLPGKAKMDADLEDIAKKSENVGKRTSNSFNTTTGSVGAFGKEISKTRTTTHAFGEQSRRTERNLWSMRFQTDEARKRFRAFGIDTGKAGKELDLIRPKFAAAGSAANPFAATLTSVGVLPGRLNKSGKELVLYGDRAEKSGKKVGGARFQVDSLGRSVDTGAKKMPPFFVGLDKSSASADKAGRKFRVLGTSTTRLGSIFGGTSGGFLRMAAGATAANVAFGLLDIVTGGLMSGLSLLGSALSLLVANPMVLIITLVAALVAGLIIWIATDEEARAKIKAGWDATVTWFKGTWTAFKSWWDGFWPDVVQGAKDAWNGFKEWVGGLVAGVRTQWTAFSTWWTGFWSGIVSSAKRAWNGFKEWLAELSREAVEGARRAWDGLRSWLSDLWIRISERGTSAWNSIKSQLLAIMHSAVSLAKRAWDGLRSWLSELWIKVSTRATSAWRSIRDQLAALWNAAVSLAKRAWDGLRSWLSELWIKVSTRATSAWRSIRDQLAALWNATVAAGKRAWDAFRAWLSELWVAISTRAVSAWNSIKDQLVSLWNAAVAAGKRAWDGLRTWLSELWTAIGLRATSAWNSIKEQLIAIWSGFLGAAKRAFGGLAGYLSDLWRGIATRATSAWQSIKGQILAIVRGIPDGVKDAVDKIVGFFTGLPGRLKNALGGLKNWLKDAFTIKPAVDISDINRSVSTAAKKKTWSPAKLLGFDRGGWTGPGPRFKAAGIVHADEFVLRKVSRRKLEQAAPGALEYMNATGAWPGYDEGGRVADIGARADRIASLGSLPRSASATAVYTPSTVELAAQDRSLLAQVAEQMGGDFVLTLNDREFARAMSRSGQFARARGGR